MSTEFELFEQALATYEQTQNINQEKQECSGICYHNNIINENGIISCVECGEEIRHSINHEK